MRISDWSADVCSSDLPLEQRHRLETARLFRDERFFFEHDHVQFRSVRHRWPRQSRRRIWPHAPQCRFLVRRRSEEHTSELQSLMRISYAVFCLKKKNNKAI